MSAGTGGTSATIGRYLRYRQPAARGCASSMSRDSAFYPAWQDRRQGSRAPARAAAIEGIGRPRVEPSFIPDVIDHMILRARRGIALRRRMCCRTGCSGASGGSTGTNFVGLLAIASQMMQGRAGRARS